MQTLALSLTNPISSRACCNEYVKGRLQRKTSILQRSDAVLKSNGGVREAPAPQSVTLINSRSSHFVRFLGPPLRESFLRSKAWCEPFSCLHFLVNHQRVCHTRDRRPSCHLPLQKLKDLSVRRGQGLASGYKNSKRPENRLPQAKKLYKVK